MYNGETPHPIIKAWGFGGRHYPQADTTTSPFLIVISRSTLA